MSANAPGTVKPLVKAKKDDPGLFEPLDIMGVLLWADGVEKIDVLLLEIRHLQVNLIYSLDAGGLLEALHFEEGFIWGAVHAGGRAQDWSEVFGKAGFDTSQLGWLAAAWVPSFREEHEREPWGKLGRRRKLVWWDEGDPGARREGERGPEDVAERLFRERRDALTRRLTDAIWDDGWLQADWGRDARRALYLLEALQRLKRNLVLYKLHLCWWGWWARCAGNGRRVDRAEEGRRALAHFLCVRAAVLEKTRRAVMRLGDLQAQFGNALDLAGQAERRPLGTRRRRQGVYSSFLNDRVQQIRTDVRELLDRLGLGDPDPLGRRSAAPVMAHRWQHHPSSEAPFLPDEVADFRAPDAPAAVAVEFVNSSYWMPDRPDLQGVLAHEAAHAVLRGRLNLRSSTALAQAGYGAFALLIRDLAECMHAHQLDPYAQERAGNPFERPLFTLAEIAADLLATAVYGPAYLFALAQELLGHGCAELFRVPPGEVELDLAADVLRLGHSGEVVHLEWFLRLRVAAALIEAVEVKGERSRLGLAVVKGVRSAARTLHDHLRTLYAGENRIWPHYWRHLTARMEALVKGNVAVVTLIRDWRGERREPLPEGGRGPHLRRAARSARPLGPEVNRLLVDAMVERKATGQGRALRRELGGAEAAAAAAADPARKRELFCRLYLGCEPAATAGRLFRHVYDIPWEASVLRALDFLDAESSGEPAMQGPISTLSQDFQPGRESYQIALEFAVRQGKTATDRLLLATRLVEDAVGGKDPPLDGPGLDDATAARLRAWLGEPLPADRAARRARCGEVVDTLKRLQKRHDRLKARRRRSDLDEADLAKVCDDIAASNGARLIRELHLQDRAESPWRRAYLVNRVTGRKLEELGRVLRGTASAYLVPLASYLEQHSHGRRREYERALCRAISLGSGRDHGDAAGRFHFDEIAFLSHNRWSRVSGTAARWLVDERDESLGAFHRALGRFDVVAIMPDRPSGGRPSLRGRVLRLDDGTGGGDRPRLSRTSFFEQRETGLRVALNGRPVRDGGLELVAACSIVLGQRDARLEFLGRLLGVHGGTGGSGDPSLHGSPEFLRLGEAGPLGRDVLGGHDYAYLAEGSGDLILVFREPRAISRPTVTPRRLADVLRVSVALFNDFMVDRTETVLFPAALEGVEGWLEEAGGSGVERFSVLQEVRLRSTRSRRPPTEVFLTHMRRAFSAWRERSGLPEDLPEPEVRVVPGLGEFVVRYQRELIGPLLRSARRDPAGARGQDLLGALHRFIDGCPVVESVETRVALLPDDVVKT